MESAECIMDTDQMRREYIIDLTEDDETYRQKGRSLLNGNNTSFRESGIHIGSVMVRDHGFEKSARNGQFINGYSSNFFPTNNQHRTEAGHGSLSSGCIRVDDETEEMDNPPEDADENSDDNFDEVDGESQVCYRTDESGAVGMFLCRREIQSDSTMKSSLPSPEESHTLAAASSNKQAEIPENRVSHNSGEDFQVGLPSVNEKAEVNSYLRHILLTGNELGRKSSPSTCIQNKFIQLSSPPNDSLLNRKVSSRFPTLSTVLKAPVSSLNNTQLSEFGKSLEISKMQEMYRNVLKENVHGQDSRKMDPPTAHIKIEPLDAFCDTREITPTTSYHGASLHAPIDQDRTGAHFTSNHSPVMETTFSDLIRKLIRKAELEMEGKTGSQELQRPAEHPYVEKNTTVRRQGKKVSGANSKKKSKTKLKAASKTAKEILKVPKVKVTIKEEPEDSTCVENGERKKRKKRKPLRPEDNMPVIPVEHFTNKIGYVKEEMIPAGEEFHDPLLPLGLYEDGVKKEEEEKTVDMTKPCSCNICNKVFRLYSDLEYHLRCHFGERNYKCEDCGKTFKMKQHLRKHSFVHSEEKPFRCDIDACDKAFKDKAALKKHKRTHNPEKSFFCDVCNKGFVSRLNLKNHKVIHLPDRPFKCEYCAKGFNKNANLKHHLKVHFGFKPIPCTYCGKTFPDKARWKMHERIHWEDKPFKCTICPAQFAQISNLKVHLKKHSGEKPFKCEVCGKCYLIKSYLNIHMKRHIGVKEFKCAMCGKEYYQRGEFNRHMRTHTGEKTHWCQECNVGFIDKAGYKAHQRLKHGGEMFKCPHCNKEFLHDSNLARHIACVHTKMKKHFCEKCGVGFLFMTDLRSHMNRHEGYKPYSCDICGKRFYRVSLLNMHRRVHTGEVFFCEVCNRTFNYSSSYQKHLQSVRHIKRQEMVDRGEDPDQVKSKSSQCKKSKKKSEKKRRKNQASSTEDTDDDGGDGTWSDLDDVNDDEEDSDNTEVDDPSLDDTAEEDNSVDQFGEGPGGDELNSPAKGTGELGSGQTLETASEATA